MARRDNGTGTVYQRPNGSWVGRIYLGRGADGKPKYKCFSGKNQAEVKRKIKEFNQGGCKTDSTKVSVEEYVLNWLNDNIFSIKEQGNMENTRSDSAENRLICATLFAFFASGAASVLVGNLMPFIREAYGIGYSKAGFLLSFPAWGNLAAVFITGFLPTYIGRRRTVLLTAVWMAVAFAIIGFGIGGSALLPAACLMIGVARGGNSNFSNTMMSTLPGKNPFVNHELMSISLNSTSKWRARNMPSFLEYIEAKGKLPTCLTMSFAASLTEGYQLRKSASRMLRTAFRGFVLDPNFPS